MIYSMYTWSAVVQNIFPFHFNGKKLIHSEMKACYNCALYPWVHRDSHRSVDHLLYHEYFIYSTILPYSLHDDRAVLVWYLLHSAGDF